MLSKKRIQFFLSPRLFSLFLYLTLYIKDIDENFHNKYLVRDKFYSKILFNTRSEYFFSLSLLKKKKKKKKTNSINSFFFFASSISVISKKRLTTNFLHEKHNYSTISIFPLPSRLPPQKGRKRGGKRGKKKKFNFRATYALPNRRSN